MMSLGPTQTLILFFIAKFLAVNADCQSVTQDLTFFSLGSASISTRYSCTGNALNATSLQAADWKDVAVNAGTCGKINLALISM